MKNLATLGVLASTISQGPMNIVSDISQSVLQEYALQHVKSVANWVKNGDLQTLQNWKSEYGIYNNKLSIKITDLETGAIWIRNLPATLLTSDITMMKSYVSNVINTEIIPTKHTQKDVKTDNLIRLNKDTSNFTSDRISFRSSWGVENDGGGSLKLSASLNASEIKSNLSNVASEKGEFITKQSISLKNVMFSPSFSIDNPPTHELKFYPSLSIDSQEVYRDAKGISAQLPSGSGAGEEWTNGFLQGMGVGAFAASAFAGGVGALGLIEAFVPGASAITAALEAGGFISFVSGVSLGTTAMTAIAGGVLLKTTLSDNEVDKIKKSKYNLTLQSPVLLTSSTSINLNVPARAWATSTSLFGDRTTISFHDLMALLVVESTVNKVVYDDIK